MLFVVIAVFTAHSNYVAFISSFNVSHGIKHLFGMNGAVARALQS